MNRRTLISIGFALPLAIGVAAVSLALAQPARTASLSSPDLAMARLADFDIVNANGQLQLRFSATIVNVGQGPFELNATRQDANSFNIVQTIYGSGGSTDIPVQGNLVWGGDGHSHWHVQNLETYELDRLDNGVNVGTGMKGGFCFFDTTTFNTSLPGAPASAVYARGTVCGQDNQSASSLRMGISVGWGDRYGSSLPDQYIDVTDLVSGNYRLYATADLARQFTEASEDNNTTWVDLKLSLNTKGKGGSKVRVVGYGPTP
jgi:Lysyl oxidase